VTARERRRAPSPRDIAAEITERIIAALEAGAVPWRQPWRSRGHRNAVSGRPYRGLNLLLLGLVAWQRQYADARWLTFRQALQCGGSVRRGERGIPVAFWKEIERRDVDTAEVVDRFPVLRRYTVFHVSQCDQLDLRDPDAGEPFEPLERAEAVVAGYEGGPPVFSDADAAYYDPRADEVHLPPREAFRSAEGYYATLFHELGHSTGNVKRLNREGYDSAPAFGSEVYSKEELVAELGAAILCHEVGIDGSRLDQSAAYVQSWLHALRDDRRLVVVAAGQGQRAADWILGNRTAQPDAGGA